MVLGIFKIALRLRDRHIFVWQPLRYLNIFWKTKTLFKNLERLFMVESAKIEKITFQYKTALWIADVKANRLGSTNWSISKNRTLPVTALFFRNYVSVYEPLVKSWFDVSTTQMTILIVFVSAGVLFERIYSLWVSLM